MHDGVDIGSVPGDADTDLAAVLAGLVEGTPGVLRIEPTLRGAVSAWRHGDDDGPASHLHLTSRGRVVDVAVNVALRSDHQARLLAHRLRDRVREELTHRGLVSGDVEISVLVIEPAP